MAPGQELVRVLAQVSGQRGQELTHLRLLDGLRRRRRSLRLDGSEDPREGLRRCTLCGQRGEATRGGGGQDSRGGSRAMTRGGDEATAGRCWQKAAAASVGALRQSPLDEGDGGCSACCSARGRNERKTHAGSRYETATEASLGCRSQHPTSRCLDLGGGSWIVRQMRERGEAD